MLPHHDPFSTLINLSASVLYSSFICSSLGRPYQHIGHLDPVLDDPINTLDILISTLINLSASVLYSSFLSLYLQIATNKNRTIQNKTLAHTSNKTNDLCSSLCLPSETQNIGGHHTRVKTITTIHPPFL